jgi:hypothetical protein
MAEERGAVVAKPTIEPIEFLASFPPIQSAIKRGQDGMRIQLDIPESEMPNAVRLLALMSKRLRIRVTEDDKPNGAKAAPVGDFEVTNRDS